MLVLVLCRHDSIKCGTKTRNILRTKTGGDLRVETGITAPHKNHDSKYPSKPTPTTSVEPTTSPIPTTHKKLLPPQIVISGPVSPQKSMQISLTYKARALVALLKTQAAPKHHVETLAEKICLNLFEVAIKMEKTAQTTPIGYEMETIDEETCNAMEYQKLTKHPNKEF